MKIVKAGLYDTVQDEGRHGHRRWGISSAGAFDKWSYRIGNIMLGNYVNSASLEFTSYGPTIEFLRDQMIVITGADMQAKISGKLVPMWQSVYVAKGTIIKFFAAASGMRTYLAVNGGIISEVVLASRSTIIHKVGINDYIARTLKRNDILPTKKFETVRNRKKKRLITIAERYRMLDYKQKDIVLRILSLTDDKELLTYLVNNQWVISTNINRMGIMLDSKENTTYLKDNNLSQISTAVSVGTVQIPADGNPILLGVDCQTIGGYPKPATVIAADIPVLAQLRPKQIIKFEIVSINSAFTILQEQTKTLNIIENAYKLTNHNEKNCP